MNTLQRHLFKCMVAGIAALLPILGTVLMILYFEDQLAGTWLKDQGLYQFSMVILFALVIVYLVGLAFSTFLGRWLWSQVDMLVIHLPLLGPLYQTFKQLLCYGDGPDAIFKRVVTVPCEDLAGALIDFITAELFNDDTEEQSVAVFLPAAPNPSVSHVIYVKGSDTRFLTVSVNEAMKALISSGSLSLDCEAAEE